jgi:hypothetical protein
MSEQKFAADAQWVMRDLQAAKRIVEALPATSGDTHETVHR